MLSLDPWEIEAWIIRLGSMPKERVAHKDLSEPYEVREAHVFLLENGQYAVVEEGCSCYEPASAEIEVFPSLAAASVKFNAWIRDKTADYFG